MSFKREEVSDLLVKCHRRCCICHRFCGVKIETDHIIPQSKGGSNDIDNAIPLCFECHAEVHLYNDKHPRGRKYLPDELKKHREQWFSLCKEAPQVLVQSLLTADSGPLSGLISELEFNSLLADLHLPFEYKEFSRAISDGTLSILDAPLRKEIMSTYVVIKSVNDSIIKYDKQEAEKLPQFVLSQAKSSLKGDTDIAKEAIDQTLGLITRYLNGQSDSRSSDSQS